MMNSKKKTKVKLVALANLLLASCWGWSCMPDVRDAFWAGTMDYVAGTTTEALTALFSADDLFPGEE
jgi:hypothetical protein